MCARIKSVLPASAGQLSSRPLGSPKGVTHVETFAPARPFVDYPTFKEDRARALSALDPAAIDRPIRSIISRFGTLPYCFTLQCCFGHFVHAGQKDPHSLDPLSSQGVGRVEYRIAYLALCIEDGARGHILRSHLEAIPSAAPESIQFGSPEWFWERQPNSFALQVEPERLKDKDVATIDYHEALRVQEVRDLFFERIEDVLRRSSADLGAA